MGYAYRYDQANRLVAMDALDEGFFDQNNNSWNQVPGFAPLDPTDLNQTTGLPQSFDRAYQTFYQYDAGGNLERLARNGPGGVLMDDLTYQYDENLAGELQSNQLIRVDDGVTTHNFPDAGEYFGPQGLPAGTAQFEYDELGYKISDAEDGIEEIIWTPAGKVAAITFNNGQPAIEFRYDAAGMRTAKISKPVAGPNHIVSDNPAEWDYAFYVRMGGAVAATYTLKFENVSTDNLDLVCMDDQFNGGFAPFERRKYSARYRLRDQSISGGLWALDEPLLEDETAVAAQRMTPLPGGNSKYCDGPFFGGINSPTDIFRERPAPETTFVFVRGQKRYQMGNHQGSVVALVSDKHIAVDADTDQTVDYYEADIHALQDYYPYGMVMPGRSAKLYATSAFFPELMRDADATGLTPFAATNWRFGFQGMEQDAEVKGFGNHYTTQFRQYDPRLGRWFSPDPIHHPWQSPYSAMDCNPVGYTDPYGLATEDTDDGNAAPGGDVIPMGESEYDHNNPDHNPNAKKSQQDRGTDYTKTIEIYYNTSKGEKTLLKGEYSRYSRYFVESIYIHERQGYEDQPYPGKYEVVDMDAYNSAKKELFNGKEPQNGDEIASLAEAILEKDAKYLAENGYKPVSSYTDISESGKEHIKKREELKLKSYELGDGGLTIGYGHWMPYGDPEIDELGNTITEAKADELFDEDIKVFINSVKKYLNDDVYLTQNQFDALVSLAYNTGPVGARSILDDVNDNMRVGLGMSGSIKKSIPNIAKRIQTYRIMKGTKFEEGLRNRRRSEANIFSDANYQ